MQAPSVRCRTKVKRSGSAGKHDYYVGDAPDRRATEHAHRRGYDLAGLCARQAERLCGPEEFEQVLDMVEAASRGLVDHVRDHLLRVSI